MTRLSIATVVTAAALAAFAQAAGAAFWPRPTDVVPDRGTEQVAPNALDVFNGYSMPERTYATPRAVVHYVVLGIDAPPLNDDDGDGVPDYVERVGSAADTAIAYYGRRGFRPILPDGGGPDPRPDIYVSRFAPGYFGVALPAAESRNGAFVVVSNGLDPSDERSFGSLYGTIAHELFHLVQFSYFPPTEDPAIPGWALEGTAAAMEGRVYPQLADLVTTLQLRPWLAATQRSLTAQTYGAQLFWRYLDEREPRLLPAYLTRLASPHQPRSAAAALAATYARVAGGSLATAFARFAVSVASDYAAQLTPLRTLDSRHPVAGRVAPLAVHYLRLGRSVRSLAVHASAAGSTIALVYEFASEYAGEPATTRRLPARRVDGALVYTVPMSLSRSERFTFPTLVVANGDASWPVRYSIDLT